MTEQRGWLTCIAASSTTSCARAAKHRHLAGGLFTLTVSSAVKAAAAYVNGRVLIRLGKPNIIEYRAVTLRRQAALFIINSMRTLQTIALILALVSLLYLLKGILIPVLLPLAGLWLSYKLFRFTTRR